MLSLPVTGIKILDRVQSYPLSCKKKNAKIVGSMPDLTYPHGFFDGAVAHKIGDVGVITFLS